VEKRKEKSNPGVMMRRYTRKHILYGFSISIKWGLTGGRWVIGRGKQKKTRVKGKEPLDVEEIFRVRNGNSLKRKN